MNSNDVNKEIEVQYKGVPVKSAERAVILIHGRGSDAEEILKLADDIWLPDTCYIAPQSDGDVWFPYSFRSPFIKNEEAVFNAFSKLKFIFSEIKDAKIDSDHVYIIGFSQGGCIAIEYAARNAKRYGGIFILSGALMGDSVAKNNYNGDFDGTPVFFGCSDIDEETPVYRINESAELVSKMNALVTNRIYTGIGKSIVPDEIAFINEILMK